MNSLTSSNSHSDLKPSWMIHGEVASRGLAIARALIWQGQERRLTQTNIDAADCAQEARRLRLAFTQASATLDELLAGLTSNMPEEINALVEVHIQILSDNSLLDACIELINTQHLNAEAALLQQEHYLVEQFNAFEDEYLRARKVDVQQAIGRVFDILAGGPQHLKTLAEPYILLAEDLSATDLLQLDRTHLRGIVLSRGTINSHTTIVARDLGIPALIGSHSGHRIAHSDDQILLDAQLGIVWGNPPVDTINEYQALMQTDADERAKMLDAATLPTVTMDGHAVSIKVNIEFPNDLDSIKKVPMEGIGLFRTEFLFMDENLPDEDAQYQIYRSVACAMGELPTTIRTIDSGADKPFSKNAHHTFALGPSTSQLGLRSTRFALRYPDIFLTQLRALLRASAHAPVQILIPMLSHQEQVIAVKALLNQACDTLRTRGQAFNPNIKLGAMIEVPAAINLLPQWQKDFAFLSVGSNDLIQYLLAIDRLDHSVASLYSAYHPAVIRALRLCFRWNHRIPVSLCGSLAGEVSFTRLLLLLGLREFSLAANQAVEVKYAIRHTNIARLRPLLPPILQAVSEEELRALIHDLNSH